MLVFCLSGMWVYGVGMLCICLWVFLRCNRFSDWFVYVPEVSVEGVKLLNLKFDHMSALVWAHGILYVCVCVFVHSVCEVTVTSLKWRLKLMFGPVSIWVPKLMDCPHSSYLHYSFCSVVLLMVEFLMLFSLLFVWNFFYPVFSAVNRLKCLFLYKFVDLLVPFSVLGYCSTVIFFWLLGSSGNLLCQFNVICV